MALEPQVSGSLMAFTQGLCKNYGFSTTNFKVFCSLQDAAAYAADNQGSGIFKPTNTRFVVVTAVNLFLALYAEHASVVNDLELYQLARSDSNNPRPNNPYKPNKPNNPNITLITLIGLIRPSACCASLWTMRST